MESTSAAIGPGDVSIADGYHIWYGKAVEKTTLYLPPELHRSLKEAARQEGKSQAELIREALAAYLARRKKPRLRSLGVAEDAELSGRASEAWIRKTWLER